MHARGSDYHCDRTGSQDYLVFKRGVSNQELPLTVLP
jgi:hypothetical protein